MSPLQGYVARRQFEPRALPWASLFDAYGVMTDLNEYVDSDPDFLSLRMRRRCVGSSETPRCWFVWDAVGVTHFSPGQRPGERIVITVKPCQGDTGFSAAPETSISDDR